jgi:hypothetical protein
MQERVEEARRAADAVDPGVRGRGDVGQVLAGEVGQLGAPEVGQTSLTGLRSGAYAGSRSMTSQRRWDRSPACILAERCAGRPSQIRVACSPARNARLGERDEQAVGVVAARSQVERELGAATARADSQQPATSRASRTVCALAAVML